MKHSSINTLLRLREQTRDGLERQLQSVLVEKTALEEKHQALEKALSGPRQDCLEAALLTLVEDGEARLRDTLKSVEAQEAQVAQKAAQLQQGFTEAKRDVNMVERLKERRAVEAGRVRDRAEQNTLDELGRLLRPVVPQDG